jgi:hypothetical protein
MPEICLALRVGSPCAEAIFRVGNVVAVEISMKKIVRTRVKRILIEGPQEFDLGDISMRDAGCNLLLILPSISFSFLELGFSRVGKADFVPALSFVVSALS